ncbi:MAG: guanosine monophosphate reductase [Candidatus Sericytochromatia bacterium]|nr:guanosine monophosphate reductase [Candidatus Sericytochromatia bacterium]
MAVKLLQREALTFDDVLIAPRRSSVYSRSDVSLRTRLVGDLMLDMPIISANMDTVTELRMAETMHRLGGLGVIHRFITDAPTHARMVSDTPGTRILAIGVKSADLTKVDLCDGLHGVLIDVAHGHHDRVMEMVQAVRERHPDLWVIAGNVATAEGAWDLLEAGAHAIKVGVGPGAVCTTRIVTGCGVPQLTAILEVRAALDRWWDIETRRKNPRLEHPPTLIGDGGIRNSGDMVKALVAGADTVMLGSLLAGTEEAPGEVIDRDGLSFKVYRGMASSAAQAVVGSDRTPEGISTLVPCKGSVVPLIRELEGGIRSGFSYCNAASMTDLRTQTIELVRVSGSSLRENMPHAVFGTNNLQVTTSVQPAIMSAKAH